MDKWQKRMEKVTANAVHRALQNQKRELQKYLDDIGFPSDVEVSRIIRHSAKPVVDAFVERSKTTIDRYYNETGKKWPKPLIGLDWNLPTRPEKIYLEALEGLHLSQNKWSITATTEERVKKLVTSGIRQGHSPQEISKNIENLDPQVFSKNRADLIAINQIWKAKQYGEWVANKEYSDAGYLTLKYWSTVNDNRVTRSHTANQNQGWIHIDKFFSGTGDKIAPASNNPRCRCAIQYEIGNKIGEKQPKDIQQKIQWGERREFFEKTFTNLQNSYKKEDDFLLQTALKNYEWSFAEELKNFMPEWSTNEESIALLRWKSGDYININKVFREQNIHSLYSWLALELNEALNNFPLYRGEVFRGISYIPTIQELEKFEKWDIFVDFGFMSSSTNKKVAKNFWNIIMQIQSKTGKNLGNADRLDEKEILFSPATQLVFQKRIWNVYYFTEL